MIKSHKEYKCAPPIVTHNLVNSTSNQSSENNEEIFHEPVDYETAFKKYYPKEYEKNKIPIKYRHP